MRKIVANKIFIITSLAMFIFASFSVIMITYLSNKMVGENIVHFNTMFNSKVQKINLPSEPSTTEEQSLHLFDQLNNIVNEVQVDSFRVTIASINGIVVADNGSAGDSVKRDLSEEKDFINAKNGLTDTFIGTSDYYATQVVGHYALVRNDAYNTTLVVRIEMVINFDSNYFVLIMLLVPLALLVVMGISYYAIKALVDESISPLIGIQRNIIDITNGEYRKYEVKTKYREVQRIVDEINTVGYKITNNFKNLTNEREKSRFILDGMTQGIMAISPEGYLVLMNRSCMEILACDSSLLGENISDIIHDQQLLDMINKALEIGEYMMFEYETSNHRIFSVELKQVNEGWYDYDSGIITLVTFSDITNESKSAEIRSEFFANASHELRTPLTAIKGFSELLSITGGKGTLEKCSSEICKNTDKMLALIADMLELSKLEAKLDDEHLDIIDIEIVAEEVKSKIESIAIAKDVSITISGAGKVVGVQLKLEELLTNLMENAIKYNNEGGTVTVNIQESESGVNVTIADNGIGIDTSHHARIFERFYRVDKGRDRNISSTGLGLSIVKNIVNMHRAKIAMSSKLGMGTKFIITFPSVENYDSVFINKGDYKI